MATAKPRYVEVEEIVTTTVTKADGVVLELTHEEADALMQVLDRVFGDAPERAACDRVYIALFDLDYRARPDYHGIHGSIRFMLKEEAKL